MLANPPLRESTETCVDAIVMFLNELIERYVFLRPVDDFPVSISAVQSRLQLTGLLVPGFPTNAALGSETGGG
jgi:hypothetical protein